MSPNLPIRVPSAWPLPRPVGRLLLLWAATASLAAADKPIDFGREILPVLSEHCFHCHGPDAGARKGELRLDTREGAFLKNKEGYAAVVAGNPDRSLLVERIFSHDQEEVMPPPKANRTLSEKNRALLKRWIQEGALWDTHWAFTPLKKPSLPADSTTHPVDALVRKRLQQEGLALQARAPRRTLLRRLSLDITGLPPTPAEVAVFDGDQSADAIAHTVDRLLESPRFGERMAWDWMEAARYADSNGYQGDSERTMWPWRDWVVRAFNENMRYDAFTLWQLAGDLLPNPTPEQQLATAFLRNHPINGEGGRIAEENRVDYVMDMTETTGTVWLGLTLNCCRCHDHKYDPLLQTDYYRFSGFFNQTPVTGAGGDPQMPPRIELPQGSELETLEKAREASKAAESLLEAAWKSSEEPRAAWLEAGGAARTGKPPEPAKFGKTGELEEVAKLPEAKWSRNQRKFMENAWAEADAGFKKILAERDALKLKEDQAFKVITRVMVMGELKTPRQTFLLHRGLYNQPREQVATGVPVNLPPLREGEEANRLGLARWLTGPENPLVARVTVNRLWQQIFGIGLVKTAEDFGVQAETPVHGELLDWLAAELSENGWNVKALLRLIFTSETYLQSSNVPETLARNDPQNRLLARGARFRMPAWMLRDQALAASGLLSPRIGGPPVKPYQPAGVWEESTFGNKRYVQGSGEDLYRRSLYTFWRRIVAPTMFFDAGNRTVCTVKPVRTNTPLHALNTLNDPTYVEAARQLSVRVCKPDGLTARAIADAYALLLAREPTLPELELWGRSYQRQLAEFTAHPESARRLLAIGAARENGHLPAPEQAAYTNVFLSLLNLDETLNKE
jgi:mono/diheme cytochrome c family protein